MIYQPQEQIAVQAEPSEPKKKTTDPKFNILLTQMLLSAVCALIAFSLMLVGGDTFEYSKAVFNEYFNKKTNINRILDSKDKEIVTTKATSVFGMGGEEAIDNIPYFESYMEAEKLVDIPKQDTNSMFLPIKGRITSEYGWRVHPISGKKSFHTGLDIGADYNTKIKSALSGTVRAAVKDDPDYGNYLIISHSNNVETMYAHCNKLLVEKGDTVDKKEVVALVGSTGISTGPHLHFEVRISGSRLNPKWFVEI
jgi:murein DD-endopeptidase MepM/ murein hydrolase activator NlpD